MVTKGYRKGVYDRVTEGTWKWERAGSRQSAVISRQPNQVLLFMLLAVRAKSEWQGFKGDKGFKVRKKLPGLARADRRGRPPRRKPC